jgi:hypothetical protein
MKEDFGAKNRNSGDISTLSGLKSLFAAMNKPLPFGNLIYGI